MARANLPARKRKSPGSSSEGEGSEDDRGEGPSSLASASGGEEEESSEEEEAPRYAQYEDEDDLEDEPEEDADALQNDLRALPFGALRKAQRALAQATAESDSDADSNAESDGSAPSASGSKPKAQAKNKDAPAHKPRMQYVKRSSKHAPQETTSKRPVTWHRKVVEVEKVEPRDPRFLPMAGSFDPEKFSAQYDFLPDLHKTELATLKENLARARKLVVSSPRDQRAEREAEVERLARAYKRAEGAVHRDARAAVDGAALARAKAEEREKRRQGKGAFYLKDADKKKLLLKARFDAMEAAGGKGAVRKAIEKRQKKLSQKETKKRPFARGAASGAGAGGGGGAGTGGKRPGEARATDQGWPKRRRVAE